MSEFDIILDRSQQNLKSIPSQLLEMRNLKMLYLQQNFIKALPVDFFERLPNLHWLDLRNNHITTIPKSIANHQFLENLLISDNKIQVLPNEMGLLPKIKVIQVANNPLVYPNIRVVAEGTKAIVTYLKHQYEKVTAPPDELVLEEAGEEEEEDKEVNLETEIGVMADYLEMFPTEEPMEANLMVKGLSKVEKNDSGIVHKMANPAPNKILLKSYYDEPEKVSRASTQTTDSITFIPSYRHSWMEKLKQLLNQQEKILQQERNLQALTTWRAEKKVAPPLAYDGEVYQKPPPYATDPQYQTMLSRQDINDEIDKMIQHSKKPPKQTDIEKLISDLVSQLKEMEATYGALQSPRSEIESAGAQITKIMEMHKRIMQLQEANNLLLQ